MSEENQKLGKVYTIQLDEELELDDLEFKVANGDLYAYAQYGTTSGCSDSCGSSTFCC
jgi:hypothetical protein